MKWITTLAFFALASLVTVGSAAAQDHKIRAIIPFAFNVGNKILPAGKYTIASENSFVAIRNDKRTVTVLTTAPTDDFGANKLIFHKYGDQFFLSKVVFSDAHLNLELAVSKTEKRSRLQQANLVRNDQILVALNR